MFLLHPKHRHPLTIRRVQTTTRKTFREAVQPPIIQIIVEHQPLTQHRVILHKVRQQHIQHPREVRVPQAIAEVIVHHHHRAVRHQAAVEDSCCNQKNAFFGKLKIIL